VISNCTGRWVFFCMTILMAQISFSFSGGFWPSSLPLFHGTARPSVFVAVSMNGSFVERKELHADLGQRTVHDPEQSSDFCESRHRGDKRSRQKLHPDVCCTEATRPHV